MKTLTSILVVILTVLIASPAVVFIFVSLTTSLAFAQVTFNPHTIEDGVQRASSVQAVDVDDDGDIDVLSTSWDGRRVAWYENDGNQNFSAYTITKTAGSASSVYAVDIDGDGDMDVLSASYRDGIIAWHENDGSQNFSSHTITTSATRALSVYAIDVDGDGDVDVLSASWGGDSLEDLGKIAWYENDGYQNFSAHTITTGGRHAYDVHAVDIDDDGDMDVLSSSSIGLRWHENDGNQNFITHTITTKGRSVYAVDIDDDGDMDVLSGHGYNYDGIACWHENDGNQNFSTHTITLVVEGGGSYVYAADVDSDGDMDVLSAFVTGGIEWYENDGNQNFSTHTITIKPYGATTVYAVDIDDDGDIDVLSSPDDTKIVWYENMLITNVETIATSIPKKFILHQNYPNPFNSFTTIIYSIPKPVRAILKVYDLLGKEIKILVNKFVEPGTHSVYFDASNLPSGMYIYKLQVGDLMEARKMLLMR